MTQSTDRDIAEIKSAITDLTIEMRLGFSDIKGQINNLDTKLTGEINNLDTKLTGQINTSEARLEGKIDKLDERTRLGFWGFVGRGLVLAILIALMPIVTKYLSLTLPKFLNP
jgi:hypothetical protein